MTSERRRSIAAALVLTWTASHAVNAQSGRPIVAHAPSNRLTDSLSRGSHASAAENERDVHIARARMLAAARHTDAAIAEYVRWTSTHPSDAEAPAVSGGRVMASDRLA